MEEVAQESELQCEHATLQTKVDEFDQLLQRGKEGNLLDHTFRDSTEKLQSAKRELAAKLRSTLSLKRLLEYVPSQAELIQYVLLLLLFPSVQKLFLPAEFKNSFLVCSEI
nr:uncharacterized protein LOC104110603 [Nicotiana tomentosiformis]